ncbi:GTP cyclohydrolase-2 [Buchnera aphidicola (Tetraneura ulmi)]
MNLKKIKEQSILPTPWGEFTLIGFEEISKLEKKNHVALIYGNINLLILKNKAVLVRIHSECLTGDALFSLRCDCGFQLKQSMKIISKKGFGVIIYHRQEGRNIGLLNKIKAYSLQDKGLDTVEANKKLGFLADERDYSNCSNILKILKIKKIKLLTNNPFKVFSLKNSGIDVIERISLITGKNCKNINYLKTKKRKMGHVL